MSTKQNKALIRKHFESINNKDLKSALTQISPYLVDHGVRRSIPLEQPGMRIFFDLQFAAFPDLHATIDDLIAEDDKVVARVTICGTNHGSFMGMPPTGKQATWSLIDISRLADGKIVEHWLQMDEISLMQQLGIVPPLV